MAALELLEGNVLEGAIHDELPAFVQDIHLEPLVRSAPDAAVSVRTHDSTQLQSCTSFGTGALRSATQQATAVEAIRLGALDSTEQMVGAETFSTSIIGLEQLPRQTAGSRLLHGARPTPASSLCIRRQLLPLPRPHQTDQAECERRLRARQAHLLHQQQLQQQTLLRQQVHAQLVHRRQQHHDTQLENYRRQKQVLQQQQHQAQQQQQQQQQRRKDNPSSDAAQWPVASSRSMYVQQPPTTIDDAAAARVLRRSISDSSPTAYRTLQETTACTRTVSMGGVWGDCPPCSTQCTSLPPLQAQERCSSESGAASLRQRSHLQQLQQGIHDQRAAQHHSKLRQHSESSTALESCAVLMGCHSLGCGGSSSGAPLAPAAAPPSMAPHQLNCITRRGPSADDLAVVQQRAQQHLGFWQQRPCDGADRLLPAAAPAAVTVAPSPSAACAAQLRGSPGTGGAPDLVACWSRALGLRRGETLLLALHIWGRLKPKVRPPLEGFRTVPRPSSCSEIYTRRRLLMQFHRRVLVILLTTVAQVHSSSHQHWDC